MDNPYESPVGTAAETPGNGTSRVVPVATALIVIALLGIMTDAMGITFNLSQASDPDLSAARRRQLITFSIYTAIHAAFSIPIVLGAISMVRFRSYLFSVVAVVLAMIPLFGPCYVLAIPFGVWGLVVLRDPRVRARFARDKG